MYRPGYFPRRRSRFQSVEASSPKKYFRMLLSRPTAWNPRSQKKLSASEPTSPADPEITTVFIAYPSIYGSPVRPQGRRGECNACTNTSVDRRRTETGQSPERPPMRATGAEGRGHDHY